MDAKNATKSDKTKRNKEGKCFNHGFFTLKWKYCADAIKNAIISAGINTSFGYQIPVTNNVANTIYEAPTKLRVRSESPYCLNSFTMLSHLKSQT